MTCTTPNFPQTDAGVRAWADYLDEFPPGPTRGLMLSFENWEIVDRLTAGEFHPQAAFCRTDAVVVRAGPDAMKWFLHRESVRLTPGILGGTLIEFGQ